MNITESSSNYANLEQMSVSDLLKNINKEDKSVPLAIEKALPQLETLINSIVLRMKAGGRLFYIGAGTSGRLGVVDASECPPTYGVPQGMVVSIIAGGDCAIRKAVEFAEDNATQAWIDLKEYDINTNDTVIGIAASGRTPYVIGGLKASKEAGINTGCIVCNPNSAVAAACDFPVEVVTGPEFVTGSTRMKAGTAQKLALNMISTAVMIQLGKVKGNKMVDMQLSNLKLIDRGVRMIMDELSIDAYTAKKLLEENGNNVRSAINTYNDHA